MDNLFYLAAVEMSLIDLQVFFLVNLNALFYPTIDNTAVEFHKGVFKKMLDLRKIYFFDSD